MAPHSSTLAWKIPWTEEPGGLQSVHGVATSRTWLSDFTFTFHFHALRRKWQPTPMFLPGDSKGRGSLVGCRLWGHTESDTTEATLAAAAAAAAAWLLLELQKILQNHSKLLVSDVNVLCIMHPCSVVSNSLWAHGLKSIRLLCPWDSPGKNIGVGCHLLLQGIFPTQDWTHVFCVFCIGRQILYHSTTWKAPVNA